jgi:colanic acid/amylovoran biosynthesis protein
MMIEVRKAGFVNKGAELMLLSVLDRVVREMPDADLVMAPDLKKAPYRKRAVLGLYQKVWFQRYRVQWGCLGGLVPRGMREFFGLVLDSEVDAVLDASGFSYSDQVGLSSIRGTAKALKKWKKQGTKVILLPQAFGPFENERIRSSMRYIADNADLIFARDEISYNYLIDIAGEKEHIRIAPDFTCLLDGNAPESFDRHESRFCIIPNHRMLEKTSARDAAGYVSFLGKCCRYLHDRDQKPFFLIHEGDRDLEIARSVIDDIGIDIEIIIEGDPLIIKGILGGCYGVISSRFHGLVSSLSQGIPALAVGWSHKYEMLFKDYRFTDGLLSVTAPDREIENRIDQLIDKDSHDKLSASLIGEAQKQKDLTGRMWDSVFSVLNS